METEQSLQLGLGGCSPCLTHKTCMRWFQNPRVCQPPAQTSQAQQSSTEAMSFLVAEGSCLSSFLHCLNHKCVCQSPPLLLRSLMAAYKPVYPGYHEFRWMALDPHHSQTQNLEAPGSRCLRNGECRIRAVPISVFLCIMLDSNDQSKPCHEGGTPVYKAVVCSVLEANAEAK